MEVTSTGKMSRVVITAVLFLTTALYANGQFSVTIVTNPSGPYMAGRDTVMLSCYVNFSNASFANESTAYNWSCPSACFANGNMTQNITRVIQSEDDGANISCTATTGDVSVTSNNTVLISVACPDLTPPMNGMLDCSFGGDSDLNAGDTCSYLCDTGYMLNDTATRTCQSNSTWTGTDAVCSRVTCPMPANAINGMLNCPLGDDGVLSYEDTCTLTCAMGYMVNGTAMRTCQSDGTFNGTEANCSRNTCTMPTDPMNGMISCSLGDDGVLSFEDTCTLTCAMGYMVNGAAMRTCQSNGAFSGTEANCSRNTCTMPTDPMNGMISCSLGDDGVLSFEDTCTLTCAMGYMVNGAAMRTCQSNGTFSGTEANCSRNTCTMPTDPMNGMISCSLGDDGVLSFEDTCTLTCAMGYMVNGAAMRTCQSNGTFSGTEANCSRIPPAFTAHPMNISVMLESEPIDVTLTCAADRATSYNWERVGDTISPNATGVNTNMLTINNLQLTDAGNYRCVATNDGGSVMSYYGSLNITVPPPTVTTSPSGPIQGAMVGSPQMIQCRVSTVSGVDLNSVMISWMGPGGNVTNNSRVTINPTTVNDSDFISILDFMYLMEGDEGNYMCSVTILETNEEQSVMLGMLTVPTPSVTVTAPNTQIVGGPLTLTCNVTAVRGITSSVDIVWRRNGTEVMRTNDTSSTMMDTSLVYTDTYNISQLNTTDEGIEYGCQVVINSTPQVMANDTVSLDVTVPTPSVTVSAPNTQIVGQSLTLECSVTAVRGITSRVDIIWRRDGTELNRTNDTSSAMMDSSLIYTDTYTISQVNTTDRAYECIVVINASPVVMATGNVTLDVMVPPPNVTISPSGPIQGAMVGRPQMIQCTVSTVSGVESSSVMISWMGPGGNVTNNSRVTINPTTVNDSDFISILYFMYLMEGDEGSYTCSVTILETNEEQSVMLGMLTVPAPIVTLTAPDNQTVGDPLTLTCNVIAVRGITSSVDIVWRRDGTEVMRTNDTSSTMMDTSLVYTDTYSISQLNTTDEGIEYECQVVINSTPQVMAIDTVSLDVTVPQPEINITQSLVGPVSGQEHTLICTVTVVSGVSSDLVMISWTGGSSLSSSLRVTISDQTIVGVMYTRTVTFSPLLNGDGGQYNCSASVTGFDETNNSDDVMVVVNNPGLMATLNPVMITGDIGSDPINLTCTASVIVSDIISAVYDFTWWRNGEVIDLSDDRIMITNDTMSSIFYISGNDTDAMQDNGMYTCQVTLTIAGDDVFMNDSNPSLVVLMAMVPPFPPMLNEVITTPYSVNISWVIPTIVFDQENYTVQYGTDMMMLQSTSELVQGSNDTNVINGMFSVDITGLIPFTTYYYVITATNTNDSTNTLVMNFTTDQTAPGIAPMGFMSTATTSSSITFQWTRLTDRQANGIVTQYIITCNQSDMYRNATSGSATMGTVTGLSAFTDYSCTIFAITVANGPMSDPPVVVTTAEAPPSPIVINSVTNINTSTVRVTWTRPDLLNGMLSSYTIVYTAEGVSQSSVTVDYNGESTQSYDITGLDPYQLVTVSNIFATNGGGTSGPSNMMSGRSSEAAPGIVVHTTSFASSTTVNVMWDPPVTPNGVITSYVVMHSVYERNQFVMSGMLMGNDTSYVIGDLEAGTPYQARVVAFTSAGRGAENDLEEFFSQELEANEAPDILDVKRLSSTSVNLTWTPLDLFMARGFPVYVVSLTPSSSSGRKKRQQPLTQVTNNSFAVFNNLVSGSTYTAEVGVRTGDRSGMQTNVVTSDPVPVPAPPGSSGSDDDNGGAIAGGVIGGLIAAAIIIVCVIIVVYYLRTRKSKTFRIPVGGEAFSNKRASPLMESENDLTRPNDDTIPLAQIDPKLEQRLEPVPLKDFPEHVAALHKDRDFGFEEEYSSISTEVMSSNDDAQLSANFVKNRYANIFPYDFSRVKISRVDKKEDDTDYINATHIDGYSRSNAYIAAQGPLPETIKDFWQMVWDQKSTIIVMLTKLVEADIQKCERYWPDNVDETIQPKPSLTIKLTQIQRFADYDLRTLLVTKDKENIPLEVKHFFFTSWPDHGVPQFATALITFIKRVRQSQPKDTEAPLLVHCSAGVGRTGTFITLDTMLERMQHVDNVNVYECVKNMRARRVFMVQTQAQYVFIHDALEELITCGDTSFNVQNMRVKVNRMSKVNPETEITGYQKQFQVLEKVSRKPNIVDCSDAQMQCNKAKNRFEEVIPFDAFRVCMKSSPLPGSDYINASRVDGYKERNAFIATQCPMENTIGDFWKMIWENRSAVIVVLCSEKHDEKNFLEFWPKDKVEHGKITVQQKSFSEKSGYGTYKFTVVGEAVLEPEPLQVTMLHYADWPNDDKPTNNAALLALIKDALELQRNTGNRAMTVMCSDGCGRTGTFITVYYTIERLKVEGLVDIFQAVKNCRIRRSGIVANLAQYEACHEVVTEFLDEFEAYANFK